MKKIFKTSILLTVMLSFMACSDDTSFLFSPVSEDLVKSEKKLVTELARTEKVLDSKEAEILDNLEEGDEADLNYLYSVSGLLSQRFLMLANKLSANFPESKNIDKFLLRKIELGMKSWSIDLDSDIARYRANFPADAEGHKTVDQAEVFTIIYSGYLDPESEESKESFDKVFAFEEKYRGSEEALDFLLTLYDYGADDATKDKIVELLTASYSDDKKVEAILGRIPADQIVGSVMDFSFTDVLTNTEYSVSDFKGKLVVIDFWATWCGPCVASIPEVRELQAKYSDKVAFIGVSLDQGTAEKFISFCEKNEMIWPQFFDKDATSALATKYSVFGIPTLFLLDREGKIITTEAREDLEGLIKANL